MQFDPTMLALLYCFDKLHEFLILQISQSALLLRSGPVDCSDSGPYTRFVVAVCLPDVGTFFYDMCFALQT